MRCFNGDFPWDRIRKKTPTKQTKADEMSLNPSKPSVKITSVLCSIVFSQEFASIYQTGFQGPIVVPLCLITLAKTNMIMENPYFQEEIHLQTVDFPLSCELLGWYFQDWRKYLFCFLTPKKSMASRDLFCAPFFGGIVQHCENCMLIGTLHGGLHVALFWSRQLLKINQNKNTMSCRRTTGWQRDRTKQKLWHLQCSLPELRSKMTVVALRAGKVITHIYKILQVCFVLPCS